MHILDLVIEMNSHLHLRLQHKLENGLSNLLHGVIIFDNIGEFNRRHAHHQDCAHVRPDFPYIRIGCLDQCVQLERPGQMLVLLNAFLPGIVLCEEPRALLYDVGKLEQLICVRACDCLAYSSNYLCQL